MATIYSWVIRQMDTKPKEGNLNNVVVNIQWKRVALAINQENRYTAETWGNMACQTPSGTDFTAYPDLTFEQVCGWLNAGNDVPALDANLDAQIDNQINPPIIVLPNPWDTPAFKQEIIAVDQPIV
jgi:hypothetical protein